MSLTRLVMYFFVCFLLVFPKGGIKLAGVPITWGYLGLGAVLIWFLARTLAGTPMSVPRSRLIVLALLLPFQLVAWAGILMNGIGDLGYAISFVVTFFVVPVAFILVFGVSIDRMDLRPLLSAIRFGVFFVAVYGIVLFAYKLISGSWIEIPYLTVNAGDVGELDSKHIDRGGVFKLISTYNNGNVYGVSLLILLPLFCWLEPGRLKQGVVKLSLLLTLSRTVWIGLLLSELFQRLYVSRASARTVAGLIMVLGAIAAGIWYVLAMLSADASFLLDRTLGGRAHQLTVLNDMTLLPSQEFRTIAEMAYLSVLADFGLVGLVAFLVAMGTPLILYFSGAIPAGRSAFKRSLASGLVVYLIVAMSDGATLFIPVMAFYWFVVSLLLSDNLSDRPSAVTVAPPRHDAPTAA